MPGNSGIIDMDSSELRKRSRPTRTAIAARIRWRLRRLLAARPLEPGLVPEGPLVIAGFFRTASGLGEAARACVAALEDQGRAVVAVDLSDAFGQCDLVPDIQLSDMPSARKGTLVLHANAPETERALFVLGMQRPRRWRVIGSWNYELSRIPLSWRAAERHLTEIWAPTRFVVEAIKNVVATPVKLAPHFVAPSSKPPRMRRKGGVCLTMADGRSSFERKNVLGAIEVFRRAAAGRDDCSLVVKTRNLTEFSAYADKIAVACAGDPRIRLIDRSLDAVARAELFETCDIFLSLHRAEGFGLAIAEAMALGAAIIATDWSGSRDFVDETCGIPVPAQMVPVVDASGVYGNASGMWAEPDSAAAVAALSVLLDDPALRMRLGEAARRKIASTLDGSGYARALE